MPYIGRSSDFGVRSRFQYQATSGQTISADITIDSDENGVSAGPITQDNATVTVNGYWSIV